LLFSIRVKYLMPETLGESYFARRQEETNSSKENYKERMALELAEKIRRIMDEMRAGGETIEGYQRIVELHQQIASIFERETEGWEVEGRLTEENVLAEYQAGGAVMSANFSPDGKMVVIGSYDDGMVRVLSLEEKDESGAPKVLAEYQAGGIVRSANFSPDGKMVVIGSDDGMVRVLGPKYYLQ